MILDIVTQTDFAGAIDQTYHCPGAAKVAGLLKHIREQNPTGTLFLDAGDVLCGAPICNLTDGGPVIDILNLLGVDAMTLGNHEFDNGGQAMREVLARATFPILCANIIDESTHQPTAPAKPYLMLERGGVKIGIVGVTTAYTPFMLKPESFCGFTVVPPAEVLNNIIPQVRREGADVVVVLSHLPGSVSKEGDCTGELFETADAIPPVEVMIGGHNPGSIACVRGTTVFAKAGFSAGQIAYIRLTLDENKRVTERTVRLYDMMSGDAEWIVPDPAVQDAVDAVMAPYRPVLDEPLAKLPVRLAADKDAMCALGNFYTDGLREAAHALVGIFNATSLFGYMPAGIVTAEMVMHVMCFNEDIFAGEMTGEQLTALFERTYTKAHWALNGTLQFTGLRVVMDTRQPEGARVLSLAREDGTPLQKDDRIRVGTTDYIATGGNNYREITEQVTWENTHMRTHAFFVEFLRRRGVLPHETDDRMINLDPAWPPPQ